MVKLTIDKSTSTNDPGRIQQRLSQPGTLSPAGTSGFDKLRKVQEDLGFANAEKQRRIVENDYLANSRINASKEISELRSTMLDELEDPVGFADAFDLKAEEIYSKHLSKAPSDASRASIQNVFAQQRISNYQGALATENKVLAEKVISNASSNLDSIAIDIFDNPDSFDTRLKDIDSIVDATEGVLTSNEQDKFKTLAKKKLFDFYIKGLIDKDLNTADTFVNSDTIVGIFDSDEVLKYRDAVTAKQVQVANAIVKQENAKQEAVTLDRELGISQGKISQLNLDEDLEKNLYGIKEYLGLSNKLRQQEEQALRITGAITRVDTRQKAGLPFNTTDPQTKKDLNTYFDNVVSPMIKKDNFNQVVSTFIDKYEFIPDSVKSNLLAGLHNGSDEAVVSSARLIDSLTTNDPQLARQFSNTNDLARSRMITSSVNAGMSAKLAVKSADNSLVQKNTIEFEQRKKDFKKSNPQFDHDVLTSFFINDPNTVPTAMKADWMLLNENYAINLKMSLDDARDLAYTNIKSTWNISNTSSIKILDENELKLSKTPSSIRGVTVALGQAAIFTASKLLHGNTNIRTEASYIKYSPERYYNKKGLNPSWIVEQLVDEVKEISPNLKQFNLTIDPDTIGSETPGYLINYLSPQGVPLILRGTNGDIQVWRPNIDTSDNVKEQIEEKEASAKDIRVGLEEVFSERNIFDTTLFEKEPKT